MRLQLRDCDLGPIVNRDLTRRVRTVNGLTAHRAVAQNDLRMAAKIVQVPPLLLLSPSDGEWSWVQLLDKKWGLYQPEEAAKEAAVEGAEALPPTAEIARGPESANPLLSGLSDFLIEEASAEEAELLGEDGVGEGAAASPFERDNALIKMLDRIIAYLRLVHSIDYYNAGEYPHEDEMPNRCGIVHVRGPPPADGLVPPNFGASFPSVTVCWCNGSAHE